MEKYFIWIIVRNFDDHIITLLSVVKGISEELHRMNSQHDAPPSELWVALEHQTTNFIKFLSSLSAKENLSKSPLEKFIATQ